MDKIIKAVEKILTDKSKAIIAIDGCCASGKTTLAAQLAERFDAQVIHMDDFFLPVHMRTEQRLSQAGGNVHYERFNSEVIAGLESGSEFKYRAYSCRTGNYTESGCIFPQKTVIIEGSYTLHPKIPDIFDLKIFLEISYEAQLRRILERNGADSLEAFKNKWIPLENRYFQEFDIKNRCDIKIKTDLKV